MRSARAERNGKGVYLPSLDGWRAIAIIAVILFHCRLLQWGMISDAWPHALGGRGVDLFFALSGFLICGRLLREEAQNGGISMRSFYTRRIFRIQPAALTYLAVLSILILSGVVYKLDRYSVSPWPHVAACVLMVRNIVPKTFFFETAHFWSLSVEEQFYIFLPTFLVLCKRYRLARFSGSVCRGKHLEGGLFIRSAPSTGSLPPNGPGLWRNSPGKCLCAGPCPDRDSRSGRIVFASLGGDRLWDLDLRCD